MKPMTHTFHLSSINQCFPFSACFCDEPLAVNFVSINDTTDFVATVTAMMKSNANSNMTLFSTLGVGSPILFKANTVDK